jgi:hypothetical protein
MEGKEPDKNKYSHPHDALQYFVDVIETGAIGKFMDMNQARKVEAVSARGWT